MTTQPPPDKAAQQTLYGQALRRLRKMRDMSQADAADAADVTQQAWQRYETGKTGGLLDPATLEKVTAALGYTADDLIAETVAVNSGAPLTSRPARLTSADTPQTDTPSGFHTPETLGVYQVTRRADEHTRALQVYNEDAAPYAEPGGVVLYHLKHPPRRHGGCVIKMKSGPLIIRRYVRTTPSHIETLRMEARTIDGLNAFVEVPDNIPLRDQEAVWPIILRQD